MGERSQKKDFTEQLGVLRARVEEKILTCLPKRNGFALYDAMHYATLGGGKRVRALLVYATGEVFSLDKSLLDAPAAAVEMIHAYSLIHDDLPAMDDDDLRRGRPSCHKAYGEATAILAGDALQPLAFEILASGMEGLVANAAKTRMIALLAEASGHAGMVRGQALDLEAANRTLTLKQLEEIHLAKTGALINASVALGALSHAKLQQDEFIALTKFSQKIGLAFQIKDDVLDEEGDTVVIGKPRGSDRANNKSTYPQILGLAKATDLARALHDQAQKELADFGRRADLLRHIASYVVSRQE